MKKSSRMSIVHSHAAGVVYVDDGSGNSGNSRHDRHYAYSRWLFGCWRGNGLFPGYCASVHEESDRF